jgi:hypothetical protein
LSALVNAARWKAWVASSGTTVRSWPSVPPTSALTATSSENWARLTRRPSRTPALGAGLAGWSGRGVGAGLGSGVVTRLLPAPGRWRPPSPAGRRWARSWLQPRPTPPRVVREHKRPASVVAWSNGRKHPPDTYEILASRKLRRIPARQRRSGDLAFYGSGHVELVTSRGTFGALEPGTRIGWHHPSAWWHPTMYFRVG